MHRRRLGAAAIALATLAAQGCDVAQGLWFAIVHRSDAPPRDEMRRIEAREATLVRTLPHVRVAIAPVVVLGREPRYDAAAAERLAAALRARGVPGATSTGAPIALPFRGQPNEAAILWARTAALSAHVAAGPPPDADYVLLVDVLGLTEGGGVGAVHAMAVTREGAIAYVKLWNSHQPLHKEIRPRSLDDAGRMVVTDLSRRAGLAGGADGAR